MLAPILICVLSLIVGFLLGAMLILHGTHNLIENHKYAKLFLLSAIVKKNAWACLWKYKAKQYRRIARSLGEKLDWEVKN